VGIEEPCEAGGGIAYNGTPGCQEQYPQAVWPAGVPSAGEALEGSRNPDCDAQFEHINAAAIATQAAGQPVISIDTKKEELIGPYKNNGSDYRAEGCPDQVKVHLHPSRPFPGSLRKTGSDQDQ
jgi:hypothetical protein